MALVGWEEGAAGLVHSWLSQTGYEVACFVHPQDAPPRVEHVHALKGRAARQFDVPTADSFKGLPLLSAQDWPMALKRVGISHAIILLSDKQERRRQIAFAECQDIELVNAVHPSSLILPDAIVESNVVVHARAIVGYRTEVASGVIVNTGAQLDHHTVIGTCATIDPAVVTAGNVTIGAYAHVHTGAVLIPRVTVGEEAIVGAGAVVVDDVPPRSLVLGVPAKVRRQW